MAGVTSTPAFSFVPLVYMSCFVPVPHCLYCHSSVMNLNVQNSDPSDIVLFGKDCLDCLESFVIPHGF